MATPTEESERSWRAKFIACFLISSIIAFALFRTILSLKIAYRHYDAFEFGGMGHKFYEFILNFFPLFIPAFTGIVASSLWSNSTRMIEEEREIVSKPIRFPKIGYISIFTLVIAQFIYFIPSMYKPMYKPLPGFIPYEIYGGVIGGIASTLHGSSILRKLLTLLAFIPVQLVFLWILSTRVISSEHPYSWVDSFLGNTTNAIGRILFGILFAIVIDEWMNVYVKLLRPRISSFHSTLVFVSTIFSGMAIAIWSVNYK